MEDNRSHRPLVGGAKIEALDIAPGQQTGGTLGCFAVTTAQPQRKVALTNQHVVIATDGEPGNKVGQPNTNDCGECCTSIIGTVLKPVLTETVDAASILLAGFDPAPMILDLEPPSGPGQLRRPGPVTGTHTITKAEAEAFNPEGTVGYPVWKRGFVTGLTRGLVTNVDLPGERSDGWKYKHQLLIKPDPLHPNGGSLSEEGDSGSALVNAVGEVVGIVWGAQEEAGNMGASPVALVEEQLGVKIATMSSASALKELSSGGARANNLAGGALANLGGTAGVGLGGPSLLVSLQASGLGPAQWLARVDEVRTLVTTNRRVAAVWRRNRGPEVATYLFTGQPLMAEAGGRSIRECVDRILHVLDRYGSSALRNDVALLRRILALPG